ncbi:TetR/AcrR family transcriptional regulator [Phyllobacterium sp. P30BS-XVII]|uniref:TetR/AcrR family transcriptional regulator n=1 Tax=Phyllobacterium sp. P30BS-XVII TaxID=2587046 RepID=UPI00180DB6C3|nr:TetR/AcrR family transcriptional regulator [Phyllobacterium sp. P30BS-XVII]MBA8900414.1 AcrR family transcriptional regulator [Phyllobacterium sp. P30BS-XVII]
MSTRIPSSPHQAEKEPPAMRKEPRQARSRATVEIIIRAGARVLGDRGFDGFTTNEAAEIAGVSIGSLYQYFPDKLSLIDAIRRRHLDDVLTVLRGTGQGSRSLKEFAGELVDGMIAVHSIQPALHRVLLDEAPRYEGARSIHGLFEAEYMDRYKAIITAFGTRESGITIDVAAQVLSSAVEGVIHNAVRRGMLKSQELRQELVHLICSYLR